MSGISALGALDVAIGLAVLFFLLATVCSAVQEGIANILGWRAKTLEDAIRNLLGDEQLRAGVGEIVRGRLPSSPGEDKDTTETLFDHWRIKALVRQPDSNSRRRARPSYMPARAFSLALSEILAVKAPPQPGKDPSPWAEADAEILRRVKEVANDLQPQQLRALVLKATENAHGSLEGFRVQVEHAFDDVMERASGWYKRKVQMALLVIAAVLTIGLNVNTVQVSTRLWTDQALRSAVAARAGATGSAQNAANAVDQIPALKLPVGWGTSAPGNVFYAIPGWAITIAALNLGAPFWFDLLSRFARLRGSGVPERPRSLSDRAGTVEMDAERQARATSRIEAAAAAAPPRAST
jgi:hypothetical protein